MLDPRVNILADNLLHYAIELKKAEKVLISMNGSQAEALVLALARKVHEAGGIPFFFQNNERILRALLRDGSMDDSKIQLDIMAEADRLLMSRMDAYIGIGCVDNPAETGDIPSEKMDLYMKHYVSPVHFEERIKHTRWVVLRYPTNSMAQAAGMSLEGFEEFFFKVCNLNYKKMSAAMDHLVGLMDRTDRVRIKGPGTDLRFSIKGIPSIKCDGKVNIPDGEVFTAPIRDSVEGKIQYNCPSEFLGFSYDNIQFHFEKGKITKSRANDSARLEAVLDTDEGARHIGEFAIGVNPYILKGMKNTLFDEKIMGSFHLTPGEAYDEANNGNKSSIHWDLVCIQTKDHGGGEMYFDDVLVRKDGLFCHPALVCLNPGNLI